MISFPNAKINLGLYITGERPDGYHDIATVMVNVGWRDILEIVESCNKSSSIHCYGRIVDCPPEKNLVMKAYSALSTFIGGLPPVEIHLDKIIPDGAGLGGGSSDASHTLLILNKLFNLGLPKHTLAEIAASIGADCPFFIYGRPALCTGIGEIMDHSIDVNLNEKSILIAKPRIASVSTRKAYAGIKPRALDADLREILKGEPSSWRGMLHNQFEDSVFPQLPSVARLKQFMYDRGADYAAMSGSGAAMFGIFATDKMAREAADKLSDCDKIVTRAIE